MAAHTLWKLPTTTLSTSTGLFSNSNTRRRRPQSLPQPWLGTNNVSLQSSNLRPHVQSKHRPVAASVSSSLPTANPERFSSAEKVPKWSRTAIKSFAMGELEARKLKYPTTGTEAILMGILIEGTSLASKFLRANGITLFKVRDETIKLRGKAEMYFFSPEHPPLTEAAQRALDWAVDHKLKAVLSKVSRVFS
ncbi:ATP-dependent Clp protease ATP-binding subunit CLPT2, chloroplastic-like isoform X2 [Alnus glutinosa]|uniref:ATP-dependent Clp protease ATP-binding subunit CLPT2, chloroplastic-like isoform X2 n=1 Tax=Alnus glutinosa TaxID=3517 RepID=UPI002D7703E9|nr:ATP-dependent Clp protease ATP-binding subunit CLPT2, chloroplastic-like isoform X2 [Alnus glutinosa]